MKPLTNSWGLLYTAGLLTDLTAILVTQFYLCNEAPEMFQQSLPVFFCY